MGTASDCHPDIPNSRQALIDATEAHIAREQLTRTGLGRHADDGSFPGRLDRNSDARLNASDKELAFLGEEPIGPRFSREKDTWLDVDRTKPHLFGRQAPGDPTFALSLSRGRSPTLATVDWVRAFMAARASPAAREAVRVLGRGWRSGGSVERHKRRIGRWLATSVTSRRRKRRRCWG